MIPFPSKHEMQALLNTEIESLSKSEREYILPKLIPLQLKILKWEYGEDEPYESWVFADFHERNVGIAYCLGGFGAMGSPWGLIFLNDDGFGMDPGWYENLSSLITDGWVE